jgi:DNA polymerase-3 subunit delta
MKKTVAAKFFKEGKTISPALIDLFFEGLPLEAGILEQEVIKLICYVGERKEIKLEDIQAISATCKTKEGWQIADDLVWSGKLLKIDEEVELFALIGQIRFYLEKGLMIASLVEQGKSLQDISDGYPDISNSVLQKFSAKPKKTTFFTKGLILLFEFELAAKNSGGDIRILFDIFSGKLHAAAAA